MRDSWLTVITRPAGSKEWPKKWIVSTLGHFLEIFWKFLESATSSPNIKQIHRKRVKENKWKRKSKSWYIEFTPWLAAVIWSHFQPTSPNIRILFGLKYFFIFVSKKETKIEWICVLGLAITRFWLCSLHIWGVRLIRV